MLGAGGSAEVAKTMGEGRDDDANSYFTTLTIAVAALGIFFTAITIPFIRQISYAMGASDALIEYCMLYGVIGMISNTPYMLQTFFLWCDWYDLEYAIYAANILSSIFYHCGKT